MNILDKAILKANLALAPSGGTTVSIKEGDVDVKTTMDKMLGFVLDAMRYGGIFLIAYGVYEIIMAMNNNQPEAKTKGVWMVIGGAAAAGLKSILQLMGLVG